jgi:SNF2 family DNA or RNA helicase
MMPPHGGISISGGFMLLDYNNGQIIVTEGHNEEFMYLRKNTKFSLCERIRNGKYEVPYVALSLLVGAIKRKGYSIQYSQRLKEFHERTSKRFDTLEKLKESSTIEFPQKQTVMDFINEVTMENQKRDKEFKYTQDQIDTVMYSIFGKKVLIANEVGTGKTLVANTVAKFLLKYGKIKKILVLLPATLVKNYRDDYVKFFGETGYVMIGKEVKKKRNELYKLFATNDNINFLFTNYEKCNFDHDMLKRLHFDMVIVDEFHIMKNFMAAQRSKNFFAMVKQWNPGFRLPLSGTPIENKLFDLYPLFLFLNDGFILGGQNFFENNFVEYETITFRLKMKNGRDILKTEHRPTNFKNKDFLKELIKPFIIRKKIHLPVGLHENFIPIIMNEKMKKTYKEIKLKTTGASAKYHALRQFLCDPLREGYADSPKLDYLDNILDQTGEKMVIFSFYKCSIAAIERHLTKRGIKCMTVTGDDDNDPVDVINEFRRNDAQCLLSTDKINYGVNIQFAKFVIHWEFPIKPTTYFQRNGRLYRTGQKNDVQVYTFYVTDSVEEKIHDEFTKKRDIIVKIIFELNDTEMEKIENDFEKAIINSL